MKRERHIEREWENGRHKERRMGKVIIKRKIEITGRD